MIRISNTKTSVSKTVDATRFYYDSLQPMIIDPSPYGSRDWDEASKIFFNVPESNSELSKSQLRDTFRHLHLDYNLFMDLIKTNEHPFRALVDKPYKYNRPSQLYIFEQDDGTGIFMGEHLDYIAVEFIDKLN